MRQVCKTAFFCLVFLFNVQTSKNSSFKPSLKKKRNHITDFLGERNMLGITAGSRNSYCVITRKMSVREWGRAFSLPTAPHLREQTKDLVLTVWKCQAVTENDISVLLHHLLSFLSYVTLQVRCKQFFLCRFLGCISGTLTLFCMIVHSCTMFSDQGWHFSNFMCGYHVFEELVS